MSRPALSSPLTDAAQAVLRALASELGMPAGVLAAILLEEWEAALVSITEWIASTPSPGPAVRTVRADTLGPLRWVEYRAAELAAELIPPPPPEPTLADLLAAIQQGFADVVRILEKR